jgi:hypothetical protein
MILETMILVTMTLEIVTLETACARPFAPDGRAKARNHFAIAA